MYSPYERDVLSEHTSEDRVRTSVIPTVSGILWQSVDPHGRNPEWVSTQMILDSSTSTNSLRRYGSGRRCSSKKGQKCPPNSRNTSCETNGLNLPTHGLATRGLALNRSKPTLDRHLRSHHSLPETPLVATFCENTNVSSSLESSQNEVEQHAYLSSLNNGFIAENNTFSPVDDHCIVNKSNSNKIIEDNVQPISIISGTKNSHQSVVSSDTGSGGTASSRIQRMAERINHNQRCRLILWLMAFVCAANVVFFLVAYDSVVNYVAVSQLALHESGPKYEAWTKTPVPVYYKVFIFNLTNPKAFMDGDRPRVDEIGPYAYRMAEEKVDIQFNDNGTVTYRTKATYFYEPALSYGSEDDILYTVDIPFVNAADAVKHSAFLKPIISIASHIHNFEAVRRLTVRELLWGYESNVLNWGRYFQELPYPHLHFGLLVGFNDTVQESYTMFTGADDPSKMNAIHSWNGKTKLDFWSGESCNKIYGTDASGFSPGVSRTDTLHIFNGQLCRSIPLVYQKSVLHGGINAYRFVPPPDVFNYGSANPENACFCTDGSCPPRGLLDMKPCYWGAAIAFSFPHFYQADPTLTHIVQGLRLVMKYNLINF